MIDPNRTKLIFTRHYDERIIYLVVVAAVKLRIEEVLHKPIFTPAFNPQHSVIPPVDTMEKNSALLSSRIHHFR